MKTAFLVAVTTVGLWMGARTVMADSAEPTFDGLDKDHDGFLSKDEVAAMFAFDSSARHAGNGSGLGAGGGGFGHGGHGGGTMHGPGSSPGGVSPGGATRSAGKPPNVDEIFKSWDKNGDGKVSREEFDARPHAKGGGRKSASNADNEREPPHL